MSSDYEKAQLLGSRVQLAGSQQKCRAEDMASLFLQIVDRVTGGILLNRLITAGSGSGGTAPLNSFTCCYT